MYRTDGGIVDAELIRPRTWIKSVGIEAGKLLPMNIEELQVKGSALVTGIDDCPEIADGEGSVVTARFCTRKVHAVAQVEVLGTDGQIETITGTTIHPIWSEDKQDWVPLGELRPGEQLRGEQCAVTVMSVTIANQAVPVYNIEVHGEHVYQVGELGLLVHNACSSTSGHSVATALGQKMHKSYKAGIADNVTTFKEYVIDGTRKKIDFVDFANGIIYELKPNNANAIARGYRQAQSYSHELQRLFPGINWKTVVDTY